jgi:hypothetical protein
VTDNPLPDSGREREIFLVALARMSAECRPPELLAECPFSIDTAEGVRGCGEECEALLSQHPVRRPGSVEFDSSGLTATPRPKPTSGSRRVMAEQRAFDATEVYYRQSDSLPVAQWSPVALLMGVSHNLQMPPEVRTTEIERQTRECLEELGERGFNVDALLSGPIADRVARAMCMAVVEGDLEDTGGVEKAPVTRHHTQLWSGTRTEIRDRLFFKAKESGELPAGKVEVANLVLDEEAAERLLYTLVGGFSDVVTGWARSASFEELADWDLSEQAGSPRVEGLAAMEARWLFDRFTQTYLRDWAHSSLRLEWQYHRGKHTPEVDSEVLTCRRLDPLELAERVADAEGGDAGRRARLHSLTFSAVDLLGSGHRSAAAALFDAARQQDWDDAALQNNYGFCLLPDSPDTALEALELAQRQGFAGSVNRANRALCLFHVERPAAALENVERALEEWDELETDQAWLWAPPSLDTDHPELEQTCPRCYLIRLGAHIASRSQDPALDAVWTRRLGNLRHVDHEV